MEMQHQVDIKETMVKIQKYQNKETNNAKVQKKSKQDRVENPDLYEQKHKEDQLQKKLKGQKRGKGRRWKSIFLLIIKRGQWLVIFG